MTDDPFAAFTDTERWLAWREEERNGRRTKIPYAPRGTGHGSATDPATWATRREAERRAGELVNGTAKTGVGIALGDIGGDQYLAGADLDSSISRGIPFLITHEMRSGLLALGFATDDIRNLTPQQAHEILTPDRGLADWAADILAVLASYAEVSPSGNGLKAFFYVDAHIVRDFLDRIGVAPGSWGVKRGIPGLSAANHGPGIELYLSHRYFTVTRRLWSSDQPRIVLVAPEQLADLAKLIPPPASSSSTSGNTAGSRDTSRSGKAWRAALGLHAGSFEEMCAGLFNHPDSDISQWARTVDDRQLLRLWDRGAGRITDRSPERTSAAPPVRRPTVQVIGGELPAVVDQAESLLLDRDRGLYEFGDQVVRPAVSPIRVADNKSTIGLRLVPVGLFHMIERFTRHVDFQKFLKTEDKWVSIDCPKPVAQAYLDRAGLWRLPKLTALTCCPVLLADGRILDRPGFDPQSGILFDPQNTRFPPVPDHPTKDAARAALDLLKAPFAEFPFVSDEAKSVLWSALLSGVARPAFDFAPLHGFDAPVAGTGKSKLVDCCVILVTGHECPVLSQGDDETEFEKRLGAELLEGTRLISVDNCEAPLGGQLLSQAMTQNFLKVRVLGLSKTVLVTNGTMIFATGNNLKLHGDMLRRGLIGRLDAGVERPELRPFTKEDPVRVLKRERGRYVVAALTVLRAYLLAADPVARQPLGGFEGWSGLVRNALIWLGEADPTLTIDRARGEDPEQLHLEAVITQWGAVLSGRSVTTRTLVEEACGFTGDPTPSNPNHIAYWHPEFRNALLDVANERGRLSAQRLGKWLSKNKNKVVGNRRLAADTPREGYARWRLEQLNDEGKWR